MSQIIREIKNVMDETTLHYQLAGIGSRSMELASDDPRSVVAAAQSIAGSFNLMRGGRTLLTSFCANRHITARVDGHQLSNCEPIVLFPTSYFGVAVPIDELREAVKTAFAERGEKKPDDFGNYRDYNFAVRTDSGEFLPLAPGERVYNLKTGELTLEAK